MLLANVWRFFCWAAAVPMIDGEMSGGRTALEMPPAPPAVIE
jgi:hypothetical protein